VLRRLHIIAPLVLVTVCAVFAIPNLYTALQRAKQKRSMSALRDLGVAIDNYAKHGTFPPAGYHGWVVDGWNHPILYHASAKHYVLRSTGRDGRDDGFFDGVTTSFDDDIVFGDEVFRRFPSGVL
jgi:hypothetical protein